MPLDHLVLPARLRWIEREKADQFLRLGSGIPGYFLIGHPQTGEPGFPTEHDRLVASRRGG
jgi:hypothetical protein